MSQLLAIKKFTSVFFRGFLFNYYKYLICFEIFTAVRGRNIIEIKIIVLPLLVVIIELVNKGSSKHLLNTYYF